jgi:hypothetical protein
MDLNHPVLQLPYVSNVLQVAGKDYNGEGTNPEVLTEIEKGHASRAGFDPKHRPGHALRFADMRLSLGEGDAISFPQTREQNQGERESLAAPEGHDFL